MTTTKTDDDTINGACDEKNGIRGSLAGRVRRAAIDIAVRDGREEEKEAPRHRRDFDVDI